MAVSRDHYLSFSTSAQTKRESLWTRILTVLPRPKPLNNLWTRIVSYGFASSFESFSSNLTREKTWKKKKKGEDTHMKKEEEGGRHPRQNASKRFVYVIETIYINIFAHLTVVNMNIFAHLTVVNSCVRSIN